MSVSIDNKAKLDEAEYLKPVEVIKKSIEMLLPQKEYAVCLTFCDNDYIRKLNFEYRNIDRETDVLSFPLLTAISPGELEFSSFDHNPETGELMLGDIVISVEKAKEQAKEYGHSAQRELCYLCVHSVLHLFGYDHMQEDEKKLMRKKEEDILQSMGIKRQ